MLAICPRGHYRDGRSASARQPVNRPAERLAGQRLRQYDPSPATLLRAADETEIARVLVVSRKMGERILIGDKIAITVVKVSSGSVRIGVEAPPELAVMREELAEELRKAEREALESSALSNNSAG
jgi:carbon storage regulator